jgi:hypothetical protein
MVGVSKFPEGFRADGLRYIEMVYEVLAVQSFARDDELCNSPCKWSRNNLSS